MFSEFLQSTVSEVQRLSEMHPAWGKTSSQWHLDAARQNIPKGTLADDEVTLAQRAFTMTIVRQRIAWDEFIAWDKKPAPRVELWLCSQSQTMQLKSMPNNRSSRKQQTVGRRLLAGANGSNLAQDTLSQ
eukprot:2008241-Amphidinium_carterae.1